MNLTQFIPLLLSSDGAVQLGTNLVANGDFATGDLTGWTIRSSPTLTEVVAGRFHFTCTGGGHGIEQNFSITNGATYRVSFDFELASGAGVEVRMRDPVSTLLVTATGSYYFDFVASTQNNLEVASAGSGDYYLDNIAVQQIL